MPLQLVHTGQGVGAAGLGWDVPLSFLQQNRSFAYRRPRTSPGALPSPTERVRLSLLGSQIELRPSGADWIPRSGAPRILARRSGANWLVYDGGGNTFTFVRPHDLETPGLWLLNSIAGPNGNRIELTYQLSTWPLNGGSGTGIDLRRVSYNTHPGMGCAKHHIELTYGHASTGPTSIAVLANKVLARRSALTIIDIKGRSSCAEPPQTLRKYVLEYRPDPDTQLPRLGFVRMFGRQGTPEEVTPLPIATLGYGGATHDEMLEYRATQSIQLPAGVLADRISGTEKVSSVNAPISDPAYAMWQSLTDVTGNGRPDLIFKTNDKLWIAHNSPGANGTTTLGVGVQAVAQLADTTLASGAFAAHTNVQERYAYAAANRNTTNVWRQAIDMNGDGRIDIVDAAEEPDRWVVYLNTPGGPSGVKWARRSVRVSDLRLTLASRGHKIQGARLPLSRRATGTNLKMWECWRWNGSKWAWYPAGFANHRCEGTAQQVVERGPERTIVEWEIADLNGDSYPDFVFNATPVDFQVNLPDPSLPPPPHVGMVWPADFGSGGPHWRWFQPRTSGVRAALNVRGVRFDVNQNVFSRSFDLLVRSSGATGLGISEWRCAGTLPTDTTCQDETQQAQYVGLADINGDGLVDRVEGRQAYLGVYHGTALSFSPVFIQLPGPLATNVNTNRTECKSGGSLKPTADQIQGLRDLTGDGIPDYVDGKRVWIGTGAGFRPAIPISVPGGNFRFSHQTESCDGKRSNTDGGLYDINADGRPDIIGLVGSTFLVSELVGGQGNGTPDAGRLTEIANGYGARTEIGYVSAKHSTNNPVPFPEIVATSVLTKGSGTPAPLVAGTRYAYSDAELVFDAVADRFVFPGYRRRVEVELFDGPPVGDPADRRLLGAATITDTWPLTAYSPTMTKPERWLRVQRTGQVRDIYTLRGTADLDPWPLLSVAPGDARVIGLVHYEWGGRLFEAPPNPADNTLDCIEMVHPLDFSSSVVAAFGTSLDMCRAYGFVFVSLTDAYRGASPPPSTNNIQTGFRALRVDDLGRVTKAEYQGDRFRSDDDVCIETTYAHPVAAYPRWLNAVASKRVADCKGRVTYARQSWAYDGLQVGLVGPGHITSHFVQRRATDNGALLRTIRRFDATYDGVGNLISVASRRGSDTRTMIFTYDPFGLAPIQTQVTASAAPATLSSTELDPLSLDIVARIDPNQTRRGSEFDGFGRLTRLTVVPPGGQQGVRTLMTYLGYPEGDSSGRRIAITSFPDPVPPADVASVPGRKTTVFMDEVGREQRTEIELGSDYDNGVLVADARVYDMLGRVRFVADAFLKNADPSTIYGTTYHYKVDGEPACFVRGFGLQPLTNVVDAASERFPTCFQRTYADHVDTLEVQDASSLQPGTPQAGARQRIVTSAIGRPIEQSTVVGAMRLDHAIFTHDRLGQLSSMTRYADPNSLTGPVTWTWRLDSIGQVLRTQEPAAGDRHFTYSDWDELTEARWSDGGVERRLVRRFDALGRLIAAEERNDGLLDSDTVNTYSYDVGSASSQLSPTFVLGRLAQAKSPAGNVTFSYDDYGSVNAMLFTDGPSQSYLQRKRYHADGRLAELDFELPDTGYQTERVKYSYDTADRLRSVTYSDQSGSRPIYGAEVIDALGRVRKSIHGSTTYHAQYSDAGRNLLTEAAVQSPHGSRELLFIAYDSVGRELVRREIADGAAPGIKLNSGYDALGRLTGALSSDGPTITGSRSMTFDPLGNVQTLDDNLGNLGASLTYDASDRDRICRIGYGSGGSGGVGCNVAYDAVGNIVSQATRNGVRQLQHFNSGLVRTIDQQGASARFRYDALGQVRELEVTGAGIQDIRHDRRFGDLIERRDETSGGTTTSTILRHVPGPAGTLVSRRGAQDDWIFEFGEQRGNRFFTNEDGEFVQEVDYEPFGEERLSGAAPGSPDYTRYRWNFGDTLAAFGVSKLGARLYDPAIGRFLSRDPMLVPRSASMTNPYGFAMNDPLNGSDPSGLQPEQPDALVPLLPFDFGGGSPAGSGPSSPAPPTIWDAPVNRSGQPAVASIVSLRRLQLTIGVASGSMTAKAASKAFQDFLRKDIYTNQKELGGPGFCACASRQMALKFGDIIQPGLSYKTIKQGLASETSPNATKPGQWEYWHFNKNVKAGGRTQFSHPTKLHPDAIAQIARNSAVGTGSTDRLRWKELSAAEAREFLDQGALVVVGTQGHWMTVVRDPFSGANLYLDPYAERRSDQLLRSNSLSTAPGWDTILQYHALVHE